MIRSDRSIYQLVFLIFFLFSCSSQTKKHGPAQSLFKDYWNYRLDTYPEQASSLGYNRHPTKITDDSYEAVIKRQTKTREFLARAKKIDLKNLNPADKRDLKIFIDDFSLKVDGFRFPTYLMTLGPVWGFHTTFAGLHDDSILETETDYYNYLKRLEQYPTVVDHNIDLLKRGLASGMVPPKSIFTGYEKTFKGLISNDPLKSPYFIPFKKLPTSISKEQRRGIQLEAKRVITKVINPANRRALEFWKNQYYPKLRKSIAISDLPNGREYYDHVIRKFTTLPLRPKYIHDLGLSEVTRIHGEMKAILKQVKFRGNLKAFQKHLRTSAKFYTKTPEQLMEKTAYYLKRMDGELPKLFGTLPRLPYGIKKIPDFMAPKQTTAYYSRGSARAHRAGFYFVNTYDLRSRPIYEIEVLSYHEAVPGHHLQIALAQELEGLPDFRKYSGHTAYIEGWGLYSESLGKDVGLYEDPYNDYGRLVYELWRACRLVVDTGMHVFGWSRQKGLNYLLENSGITPLNAKSEIDRYISWPGQALAYKIGQLKIKELRERAQKKLGNKFDIRDFHDTILLSGSVPLTLMEENVENYISRKLN